MNRLANILKVFGGLLLVYSAVITFKTQLPEYIENIIYFRGILLGSCMLITGSAITTNNAFVQNLIISMGVGNFCILIASVYNLVYDRKIDLDLYFDLAVFGVFLSFVIITTIRLWLYNQFKRRSR